MAYLRGPLLRDEIRRLTRGDADAAARGAGPRQEMATMVERPLGGARPLLPSSVPT